MKWTGLTGGIATGKSTVKKLLEGRGIPVIDADQISHKLSEKGTDGYRSILSHFGQEFILPDQSLDRKKLAASIFSNAEKKAELEMILHPLIKKEVTLLRQKYSDEGHKRCFYDLPLLFEKNMQSQFDLVVLVWCDPLTQLSRLKRRSHLTEAEAGLRMSNQLPLVEKVAKSNFCLDNSGSLHELEGQLHSLLTRI